MFFMSKLFFRFDNQTFLSEDADRDVCATPAIIIYVVRSRT